MGLTDKITGRFKKAAGDLADDPSLRREGRRGEGREQGARGRQPRASDLTLRTLTAILEVPQPVEPATPVVPEAPTVPDPEPGPPPGGPGSPEAPDVPPPVDPPPPQEPPGPEVDPQPDPGRETPIEPPGPPQTE